MRNLTALYQFAAAKREELRRDDSQAAFSFADAFSQWNALADADRKRWEQKATEAQERYLSECMKRSASAVEGDAEADGDGDAEGDSDGEGDDDAAAKRDPRDDADGEMLKLELPQSRVTKVVRCNKDVGKISRDANFLIAKAAEVRRRPISRAPQMRTTPLFRRRSNGGARRPHATRIGLASQG
uniref:HMG box domain-containing protein n=1 Tax=Chrysotila carterae TaxID=13221 RepID=A0A7S4BRL9_CHRCT